MDRTTKPVETNSKCSVKWGAMLGHFGSFLLAMGLATGCTTTSGTRVPLTQADLSQVHSLGVQVKNNSEFSVRYSRDQMSNAGTAFGGLIGYGIEAGVRDSADAKRTEKLKPFLGGIDLRKQLDERLREQLQAANLFNKVEPVGTAHGNSGKETSSDQQLIKDASLDGLLVVTVQRWGMSSCPESKTEETVQASFEVNVKMLVAGRSSPAWERNELYLDGDCHTIEQLSTQDGQIKAAFTHAVEEFSGKLVNEIRFPKSS